jgi:dihydropyrimidinase/allantoinase
VRDARARGVDATAETCPPYLFYTDEALDRLGPFAKCNPPLRTAQDVETMWEGVRAGLVACIGTDHSPFLGEEKERGRDPIFAAPPGLCGLEVMVPLMLTAVHQGRLRLPEVARLCSEGAAELFRLPGKGRLAVGADADLTIVDLHAAWTYDSRQAITRSRDNMRIYDGTRLRGRVVHTLVRGVPVCRDGEVVGAPGHGRFVRPLPAHVWDAATA